MDDTSKLSMEERLEKLEKSRGRDALRQERAEFLENLKKKPIRFVETDPSRIRKSKSQIQAEKKAKKEEEKEVKKFLEERRKQKEDEKTKGATGGVQKGEEKKEVAVTEPKATRGRPKKVE